MADSQDFPDIPIQPLSRSQLAEYRHALVILLEYLNDGNIKDNIKEVKRKADRWAVHYMGDSYWRGRSLNPSFKDVHPDIFNLNVPCTIS